MATAAATKTRPVARPAAPQMRQEADRPKVEITAPPGRKVALGRDGKPIWRQKTATTDPFHIDERIIPDDWSYEWKRRSVYGWEDTQHQVTLGLNGWTPVPAERHDGMFMAPGAKGAIERDGMILMERPLELTLEAKIEEKQKADRQYISSHETIGHKHMSGPLGETHKATVTRKVEAIAGDAPKYDYSIDE